MKLIAGLDLGSTTTKVVLLADGRIAGKALTPTGTDSREAARTVLEKACAEAGGTPNDIATIAASGYGRRLYHAADKVVNEITANAVGVGHLLGEGHAVRTIIDVGGQDSKIIRLDDDGRMSDFAMNDRCAAGTGRFFDNIARALGIKAAELGEAALESHSPEPISSLCAVFAESEVVSLIAQGKRVADIAAGIHAAVAKRIAQMGEQVGIEPEILLNGGGALNVGLQRAVKGELNAEITVPELAQYCVALGAAASILQA